MIEPERHPATRMRLVEPAWKAVPFVDPISELKEKAELPQRDRPVNVNHPAQRSSQPAPGQLILLSVGSGQAILVEPEEDAEGEEKRTYRVKSIKSVGDGVKILKDAAEGQEEEIHVRSLKEADESQMLVEEDGEKITVRGTGVEGSVDINIDGRLEFGRNGMLTSSNTGQRGKNLKLVLRNCGSSGEDIELLFSKGYLLSGVDEEPTSENGGIVTFTAEGCDGSTTFLDGP